MTNLHQASEIHYLIKPVTFLTVLDHIDVLIIVTTKIPNFFMSLGWEDGWRTSLMDKQRPLVNIKHGRLYLTQKYECYYDTFWLFCGVFFYILDIVDLKDDRQECTTN